METYGYIITKIEYITNYHKTVKLELNFRLIIPFDDLNLNWPI